MCKVQLFPALCALLNWPSFVSFCPEKRKFSFVLKRNEAIMFVIIIIFCIFAPEKD